jgi:hypothetical protein
MSLTLTISHLKSEASCFAVAESAHSEPTIYGVTDGKAIGTYLEHKFQQSFTLNMLMLKVHQLKASIFRH